MDYEFHNFYRIILAYYLIHTICWLDVPKYRRFLKIVSFLRFWFLWSQVFSGHDIHNFTSSYTLKMLITKFGEK